MMEQASEVVERRCESGLRNNPLRENTQTQGKRLPPRLLPILLRQSAKRRLLYNSIHYSQNDHYKGSARVGSKYSSRQRTPHFQEPNYDPSEYLESSGMLHSEHPLKYDGKANDINAHDTWNLYVKVVASGGSQMRDVFPLAEKEGGPRKELPTEGNTKISSASFQKQPSTFSLKGNLASDNASKQRTTVEGGRVSKPSRRHTRPRKMSMENARTGFGVPLTDTSPSSNAPSLHPQPLLGALLRKEVNHNVAQATVRSNAEPKHATLLYPSRDGLPENGSMLNMTSTPLGKEAAWGLMNKTPPRMKLVFPNRAMAGVGAVKKKASSSLSVATRCCSVYETIAKNVRNKWILLFLVHCSLFVALLLYIALGAALLMKIDGGLRYAVRGKGEENRVGLIRGFAADRLLNISLKAVLEKSRDAVLDTIFMSDEMQAALTVFKASRLNILPADHELELLSQVVLRDWHQKLEEMLVKYHFITTLEAQGYQVPLKDFAVIWDRHVDVINPNQIYSKAGIGTMPWDMWSGSIHTFCLMTTMGIRTLSPSHGGRAFTVIYTILGAPLYSLIVVVWSRRLLSILAAVSRSKYSPTNRKIASSDNLQAPTGGWNAPTNLGDLPSSSTESFMTVLISFTLTFAYIIGIGPMVCGSINNSFGERLEASFLCLLLVSPPSPLPQDGSSCCGFIAFVLAGHFSTVASILSLKRAFSSADNFSGPR